MESKICKLCGKKMNWRVAWITDPDFIKIFIISLIIVIFGEYILFSNVDWEFLVLGPIFSILGCLMLCLFFYARPGYITKVNYKCRKCKTTVFV